MNRIQQNRIKDLVEETNTAFEQEAGTMNMDYAAFASLALPDFKNALQNPELSAAELRQMIRRGSQSHKQKNPQGCWATFMAHYITQNANEGVEETVRYSLEQVYKEKP